LALAAAVALGVVDQRRALVAVVGGAAVRTDHAVARLLHQSLRQRFFFRCARDAISVGGVYALGERLPFAGVLHTAAAGVEQLMEQRLL